MASTFKPLLAAAVLNRVDQGLLDSAQRVPFGSKDMLSHAPVTSRYVERGWMTVLELCEAMVTQSDNPAANLLINLIGGPTELTQFLRTIGDDVSRLDRKELELNTNLPGDPQDTTTPRAMVDTMRKLVTGAVLATPSRLQLITWLKDARTGLDRIRAGLPRRWEIGDKTGTGANGAVNDVAVAWPPARAPLLIAIYMSESRQSLNALQAAHAEIASAIADTWPIR